MKITVNHLRKIIKEEIAKTMFEADEVNSKEAAALELLEQAKTDILTRLSGASEFSRQTVSGNEIGIPVTGTGKKRPSYEIKATYEVIDYEKAPRPQFASGAVSLRKLSQEDKELLELEINSIISKTKAAVPRGVEVQPYNDENAILRIVISKEYDRNKYVAGQFVFNVFPAK